MKIRRFAILGLAAVTLAACGGDGGAADQSVSSDPTATSAATGAQATSTTAPDPKDAVRAQIGPLIDKYLASIVGQMPDVTANVESDDLLKCVSDRVNQVIETTSPIEGQPDGEFIGSLLTQIQTGLFSLVGLCAQAAG